jgi:hypothetical protein
MSAARSAARAGTRKKPPEPKQAASSDGSSSERRRTLRPEKQNSEKPVKPKRAAAGKASLNRKASAGAAKGGEGKRFCRGCAKFWLSDKFPANRNLHLDCQRAKDSLHNMARRHGQANWFHEVECDDARFQALIAVFKGIQLQSSSAKSKFALAVFAQSKSSSTNIIHEDVGEMMWEESFITFAATAKGGKLNPKQAKLEWDQMAASLGGRIHDQKGPMHAPLRILIANAFSRAKLVFLRNAFSRAKLVEASTSAVKDVHASKLNKMTNEALQSSMVANDEHLQDVLGIARDAKKSGAGLSEDGSAFSMPSQNGFITDVEAGRIDASQDTGPRASAGPRPGVIRFDFKHLAAHWQGHGHDEAPRLELGIIMGQAKATGTAPGRRDIQRKGSLASARTGTAQAWKKRWAR